MVTMEKKSLSLADIEAQSAVELPDRETLAVLVSCVAICTGDITVDVKNNNVAVQVCAVVQAINGIIAPTALTCRVVQG